MTFGRLLGLAAIAGCAVLVLATLGSTPQSPVTSVTYYGRGQETVGGPFAPSVALAAEAPTAASPAPGAGGPEYDRLGLAVVRPPSVDAATIRTVLLQAGSPAAGEAQAIYDLGVRYGLDPAICLAFFVVESNAGTRGMATETHSLGNIRATAGYVNYKGYRKYDSWREGIEDWYRLISRLYVGEWSLMTVETIVPVYAPAGDGNEPAAYVSNVRQLVREWRANRG